MKLTIKTLQQSTFKVDIEADKTVKELKDKIEKDHGQDYPSGAQKLIYSGKILADENKLSEYDIDEKKFVVLMITRPPPAQKIPATEKPIAVKKDEPAGAKTKASEEKTKPKPSTTQSSPLITVSSTNSTTPTTAATPNTTSTIQQATLATAAGNRPTGRSSALNEASSEPQIASRLASLMMQPHFRQIQDLIQQSPHLLSSTIEALAGSDPEMYNFISENPDVFVNALNHPPSAGNRTQSSRSFTTSGQQQPRQGTQDTQQASAGRNLATGRQQPVVDFLGDVSERDKEAIERLKELGFSEYLAVQAYMACDKDEQLAANLLFQMDQ